MCILLSGYIAFKLIMCLAIIVSLSSYACNVSLHAMCAFIYVCLHVYHSIIHVYMYVQMSKMQQAPSGAGMYEKLDYLLYYSYIHN